MKTIKTLKTIAAVMAVSFSVSAMAVAINALPSGFDTTKNIGTIQTGLGSSITQMGSIIDAFGAEGSVSLTRSEFWNTFIGAGDQDYFNYELAKPLIEELVYTVEGKVASYGADSQLQVDTTGDGQLNKTITIGGEVTWSEFETFKVTTVGQADVTAADRLSAIDGRTIVSGDLDETGQKGADLLASLGWDGQGTFGLLDTDEVTLLAEDSLAPGSTSALSAIGTTTRVLSSIARVNGTGDSQIAIDARDASIAVREFNNARLLIAKIAEQRTTGNILDVAAATAGLSSMIDQHNSWMGATIVMEAQKLKAALKDLGYQTAASALGKATNAVCRSQNLGESYVVSSCTAVGDKFTTISSNISNTDASTYNNALEQVAVFADEIIAFNGTVGNYDASDAFTSITTEYGTITSTNTRNTILDWGLGMREFTFADDGSELFDSTFDLEGVSGDFK